MGYLAFPTIGVRAIFVARAYSTGRLKNYLAYKEIVRSSDIERIKKIYEWRLKSIESMGAEGLVGPISEPYFGIQNVGCTKGAETPDDLKVFHNLPYSERVSAWPDRTHLQGLLRENFRNLFESGDLAVIPGVADCQLAIELLGHSAKFNMDVNVLGADINETALKLGLATMEVFGMNRERLEIIRANTSSREFLDLICELAVFHKRCKVITLLQPSISETELTGMLEGISSMSTSSKVTAEILAAFLLLDRESSWYIEAEKRVANASKSSSKPRNIWRDGKYVREELRLGRSGQYYPQQTFVRPEKIEDLRRDMGFLNVCQGAFCKVVQNTNIQSKESRRILCYWRAKGVNP